MKRRSFLQFLGLAPVALLKTEKREQSAPLIPAWTLEETAKLLKKEWGKDFDRNIVMAQRNCEQSGYAKFAQYPEFGNNPEVIKCFQRIGEKVLK